MSDSKRTASFPRVAAPLLRPGLLLLAGLTLVACGGGEQPPASTPAQPTTAAPAEPAPAPAAEPAEEVPAKIERTAPELLEAARTAMNEQRMFSPPNENAFELYMDLLELEPDNRVAKNALVELFPFVMIGMEQRLGDSDVDEARRILALLERADAQAPALPRLRNDLAALERRLAEEEQRRLQEEARQAEAAAAAARAAEEAARAPEPEPEPAPAPAETTPTPAPAQPTPQPTPARPTPAQPAEPAGPTSVDQLRVLRQSAPRYPPQAYRRRQEGTVEIEFVVMPDGSVGEVTVISSEPRGVFDREAINAMKEWRFEAPGRELRGRRAIDFKLE